MGMTTVTFFDLACERHSKIPRKNPTELLCIAVWLNNEQTKPKTKKDKKERIRWLMHLVDHKLMY